MKAYIMKGSSKGMTSVDAEGNETVHLKRPEKVLAEECLQHGSSLSGREESFRYLTGCRQKAAVLVSEEPEELWFPTLSKKNADCIWISYLHAVKAFPAPFNQCEVLFDNGMRIALNCSCHTIGLQMKRCHVFLQKINGTAEKNK
jgi:competence protein ComK